MSRSRGKHGVVGFRSSLEPLDLNPSDQLYSPTARSDGILWSTDTMGPSSPCLVMQGYTVRFVAAYSDAIL